MGKELQQNLQQQQSHESRNREGGSSGLFCERCSMGLSILYKEFSFRCFLVLILSLSLLVSGIFWILPPRTSKLDGFDAKDEIKLRGKLLVLYFIIFFICSSEVDCSILGVLISCSLLWFVIFE